jgi:hypothetical protein
MYSLVDGYKRFGGTCCLHRNPVTIYRRTRRHDPKDSEFDAAEPQITIQSIVSQRFSVLHDVYENCDVFFSPLIHVNGCREPVFSQY